MHGIQAGKHFDIAPCICMGDVFKMVIMAAAGPGNVAVGCDSHRAGDRARTGDVQLGKLAFYQLNYARESGKLIEVGLSSRLLPACVALVFEA